jgi:hypothetical protein
LGSHTLKQKIEVIPNDNKIQKNGFELIPIINFPLGPLLDTLFSCGKSSPISVHIPPTGITLYLLKSENTFHILHRLAIATFIFYKKILLI